MKRIAIEEVIDTLGGIVDLTELDNNDGIVLDWDMGPITFAAQLTRLALLEKLGAKDNYNPFQAQSTAYGFGSTKLVFAPGEWTDTVIKLPIRFYVDEADLAAIKEYDGAVEGRGGDWDYCGAEEYLYQKAKEEGVAEFFARTEYVGKYNGYYPIYLSDKVLPNFDETMFKKETEQWFSEHDKKNYSLPLCPPAVVGGLYATHGEENTLRFIDFVKKYNLTDLHDLNAGTNKSGEVIFFDYGGFKG